MSCNGCRVLRRGCSEQCILRPCLEWIENAQAQGNATLFVSKFFGRSDLMSFISAVPVNKRPALFQSLLFEACGRTVNPVNGAVGLLTTGNWHICQAAVETVLAGGAIGPVFIGIVPENADEEADALAWGNRRLENLKNGSLRLSNIGESHRSIGWSVENMTSFGSGLSEVSPENGKGTDNGTKKAGNKRPKLLNLFA